MASSKTVSFDSAISCEVNEQAGFIRLMCSDLMQLTLLCSVFITPIVGAGGIISEHKLGGY